MKKVVTFGELMLRLAPENYLRFLQVEKRCSNRKSEVAGRRGVDRIHKIANRRKAGCNHYDWRPLCYFGYCFFPRCEFKK